MLELEPHMEHSASTHIPAIRTHLMAREFGKCHLCALEEENMDSGE